MKTILSSLLSCAVLVAVSTTAQAALVYGQVKQLTGTATLILRHGHTEAIAVGTPIPAGSKIETGPDSKLTVDWMPGAYSVIEGESSLSVLKLVYNATDGAPHRTIVLSVTSGKIFSHLDHHDGVSDFRISTPKGTAKAIGTDWEVAVDGQDAVTISVEDGTVAFLGDNTEIDIRQGYLYSVNANGTPVPLTPDEITEIVDELQLSGFNVQVPVFGEPTELDVTEQDGPLDEIPRTKDQIIAAASN